VTEVLSSDPDDEACLYTAGAVFKGEDLERLVRPRLTDRPVRLQWHRMYQGMTEQSHPDRDLHEEIHEAAGGGGSDRADRQRWRICWGG